MTAYGGIEKAKKDILHDFFRFAFDGSGGFNDFDAGSCIDGRYLMHFPLKFHLIIFV
jgi:hypothetical protein